MNTIEQPESLSRRVFVKGLGFVSTGLVLSAMLGGCETLLEQIRNRPVRRRLRSGSPEVDHSVEVYKDAVTKMQALPSGDPRNWAAQAAIHGTVNGGFNFCQHGTSHFFSWHRAYLFYFEKICQELTGERSFGLPYWNWNQDPAMHPAFTTAGSPLNHPRNNVSVAGNAAFSNATLTTIFSDHNFLTFSSQLEGTPHNIAHVLVGQDMATGGSPLDPIFWAHHCMVDYSWAKWNIELQNDNPNDSTWNGTSWNHFVDAKGQPTQVTAGVTTLMPFLSYRYESSAVGNFNAPFDLAALNAEDLRQLEARIKEGADVRFDIRKRIPIARGVTLPIARPFSVQTRVAPADLAALLETDASVERVFLSINYDELPENNDFFVRAFVNLPGANAQTSTEDVHYAGSFAFFGTRSGEHEGHAHKTDFLVDVTNTLKTLGRRGIVRPGDALSVQLVAVPVAGGATRPEMQLMLKDIAIAVSPIGVRSK
jgi:tyrosinase